MCIRDRLQCVIRDAVAERLGQDAIRTGRRLQGFIQDEGGVTAHFSDTRFGGAGETTRGDIPVSYTHLDVYKRQAMPFRAETTRGYVTGLATQYAQGFAAAQAASSHAPAPGTSETRFRYNQDFESANAMVPSVIMLMLILIPAIMSAIGVVREKETGSIANFRSTPISRFEFLFGNCLLYTSRCV